MRNYRSTEQAKLVTAERLREIADQREAEARSLHRFARGLNRWGLCRAEAEACYQVRELRISAMLDRATAASLMIG